MEIVLVKIRTTLTAIFSLICLSAEAGQTQSAQIQRYSSPTTNLEKVDPPVLSSCTTALDYAAFVLTDYPTIDALIYVATHNSNAPVRIYVDSGQAASTHMSANPKVLQLASLPNVQIRLKGSRVLMHLKAYACGDLYRSGSANFSASGLKQQDNDVLLIRSMPIANEFRAEFEEMWNRSNNRLFVANANEAPQSTEAAPF